MTITILGRVRKISDFAHSGNASKQLFEIVKEKEAILIATPLACLDSEIVHIR